MAENNTGSHKRWKPGVDDSSVVIVTQFQLVIVIVFAMLQN